MALAIFLAISTSPVVRYTLYAISNARAPITVAPAGPRRSARSRASGRGGPDLGLQPLVLAAPDVGQVDPVGPVAAASYR